MKKETYQPFALESLLLDSHQILVFSRKRRETIVTSNSQSKQVADIERNFKKVTENLRTNQHYEGIE